MSDMTTDTKQATKAYSPMALAIAARIVRNVSAYYSDRIGHPEFSSRNAALWDIAAEEGVSDEVAAIFRGESA